MLITRAEIEGRRPLDVRIASGRVVEIGTGLEPRSGEPVTDAGGGALLPGLHDHHIHLFAWAAAERSVACGPPEVRDADALAAALRGAAPRDGWIRGVGYHASVAGEIDRQRLDAWVDDCPVRVQQRSGALWVLNSAGVDRLGLDAGVDAPGVERDAGGRATGRLYRLDAWLRDRLGAARVPSLASVGRRLASWGVTGVTDASVGNAADELEAFRAALAAGELRQELFLMGSEELPPVTGEIERGPLKIVLAESALPEFDSLAERIARSHADGRAVAIHCATRTELVVAVAAFAKAGARTGDRIEHASVAPPEVVESLAAQPLTVVTQPHFIHERGDAYALEVAPVDRPWLYRCGGLLAAGVALGAGTDAPFGHPDPWRAMRAAVERRTRAGALLGGDESLAPERALALFTSPARSPGAAPRRVRPGAPADLCLLDRPWSEARRDLDACAVRATWRRGARTHGA